jgi:hypothetical protein
MCEFVAPPKLGVGFAYVQRLSREMEELRKKVDFFEIIPDLLCREQVTNGERTLTYQPQLLTDTLSCVADRPIVVHGLSLSIGSVIGWNESYLKILDTLYQLHPFIWHSEHLAFMLAATVNKEHQLHTGIPLPLPFTEEAISLVAPRAEALSQRYGVPFLLENLTYYLPDIPCDQGQDEIDFLNALTERSGCGLLLDLYNFHCNAVNFGFDAVEALTRLRLDRVVEIHLAGNGNEKEMNRFITDAHTDVVPEAVWQLLEWVLPQTPNLAGIVYEIMDEAVPVIGVKGIYTQLERVREAWQKYSKYRLERSLYVTI